MQEQLSRKKIIGLFLILLITSLSFFSIFIFKQSNAFSPLQTNVNTLASGASITATYSTNPVQNNFLVVELSGATITGAITVTDTLGNSFLLAVGDTNTYTSQIYIAKQTHTTGVDTVTASFASSANITLGIQEMAQITSTTASTTGKGHGTTANPMTTGSFTPNLSDACFTSGIVRAQLTTAIGAVPSPTAAAYNSVFGTLFQNRLVASAQLSFAGFNDVPIASTAITADTKIILVNTGASATLILWEMVAACFPQSQVTTTTSTTLTTTSTQGIAAGDFSVFMIGALIFAFPLVFIFRRRITRL